MIIFHLVNYFCPLKAPVSLLEVIDIYSTRKHFTLTERDNRDNRDIAFVIQKQFTKMVVNTSNSPLGYSHSGEIYPEGCMIVTIKNSVADLILHFCLCYISHIYQRMTFHISLLLINNCKCKMYLHLRKRFSMNL